MKYIKLLLTKDQLHILQGLAITETLSSMINYPKEFQNYNITAMKQLLRKIESLRSEK